MTLPNFIVAGAPGCGTTSLYHYLRQHPAIHLSPIKEPNYFCPEVVGRTAETCARFERERNALAAYLDGPMDYDGKFSVTERADYERLFRDALPAQRIIGECSTQYFSSPGAAARIADELPGARVLILLRNPVDRLHAAYVRNGTSSESGFIGWCEQQVEEETQRDPPWGTLHEGRYAQHVARFVRYFQSDGRLLVQLTDDYATRPRNALRAVFDFLGVDPSVDVDVGERYNTTTVPRWRVLQRAIQPLKGIIGRLPEPLADEMRRWYRGPAPALSADVRVRVAKIYEEDVVALERLLQRDFSSWLR